MKPSDDAGVRKEKIIAFKKLRPGQFVLHKEDLFTQSDIEEWADAMAEFNIAGGSFNLPRMRRVSLQSAYKIGWFAKAPTLEDDDFELLPPALVSRVGDTVLELYNKITIPDESFI